MNKYTLLGIDPGSTTTGFAIGVKNGRESKIVDFGYFGMKSSEKIHSRVKYFYDFFLEKLKKHSVTHIALETPFLGKNPQSFLKLGYLRGVVYLLAEQHNITLLEYAPREVKQNVTGFGGASKEQVARMMFQLFPQLSKIADSYKEDVTDALAICISGLWSL